MGNLADTPHLTVAHLEWTDSAADLRRRDDVLAAVPAAANAAHEYAYNAGDPAQIIVVHGPHYPAILPVLDAIGNGTAQPDIIFLFGAAAEYWWSCPGYFGTVTARCTILYRNGSAISVNFEHFVGSGVRIERDYSDRRTLGCIPMPIASLLGCTGDHEYDAGGSSYLTTAEIREAIVDRARALGMVAVSPFHLSRGSVDIALITPDDLMIGVIVLGCDKVYEFDRTSKTPRAAATSGFDFTIAITAYPHSDRRLQFAEHVYVFTPHFKEPQMTFWLLQFGSDRHEGCPEALLLKRERFDFKQFRGSPERKHIASKLRGRAAPNLLNGSRLADAFTYRLLESRRPPAQVVRELAVGESVADIALLEPGGLHLYEVKGETDNANRLEKQVQEYDAVGGYCGLVYASNHRSFADRVPEHWGLYCARAGDADQIVIDEIRAPKRNPNQRIGHLARLLIGSSLDLIFRRLHLRRPRFVDESRVALCALLSQACIERLVCRSLAMRKHSDDRRSAVVLIGERADWPSIDAILENGAGERGALPQLALFARERKRANTQLGLIADNRTIDVCPPAASQEYQAQTL